MYLDIGICVIALICAFFGARTGFIRGCLGFVSGIVGIIAVMYLSAPVANLIGGWFGWAGWICLLVSIVAIYVIVWLIFFLLNRFVKRIKRENKVIDIADRIGGLALGIAKFAVTLCIIFIALHFAGSISFVSDAVDWLFKGSAVGTFLYDFTVQNIIPLSSSLEKAISDILSGLGVTG